MRAVDEVNKRLFSNETSLWNMWNKACIQFDPLSGLISLGSVQIQGKWWEGSPFLVAFRLLGPPATHGNHTCQSSSWTSRAHTPGAPPAQLS